MTVRLHLVFGGELKSPNGTAFHDPDNIEVIGVYPNYAKAFAAWKTAAQRTVDDAHRRYFIAHLHRLQDEKKEASKTEEIG